MRLEVRGVSPTGLLGIIDRLRCMFDLDADPCGIEQALAVSDMLRPLVCRRPGLRIPGGWDGFEIAVCAVVSQAVRSSLARTWIGRLTQRFGSPLSASPAPGLSRLFPTPAALADADLTSLGVPPAPAQTVRTIARAMLEARVDFNPDRTLEEFVTRWTALPGIGVWTAHYLALRALGHPDAFPITDFNRPRLPAPNEPAFDARRLLAVADRWRPWRGYAAVHLWHVARPAWATRTC